MTDESTLSSLAEDTATRLRDQVIHGLLRPGQRLSEARLAADLDVSRNTLREVFRLLTREGLLTHLPNRGVSVAVPTMAGVHDIYRVRRLIEIPSLSQAWPRHAGVGRMSQAVEQAEVSEAGNDWQGVGSANMAFHAAIVSLGDSPRLNGFFARIAAELRLVFGLLDSPEQLHAPFIASNRQILNALEAGNAAAAAAHLAGYLDQSERVVMAAFARREQASAPA
ncbi:GntR family transcriptional regulator [Paracoccus sp. (in: a-proteobacteria)]|uniref:GntR family transcriptional regulator n=1 Tax=Paracoccus sp. TaxID=267 RepID=UPI00396CD1B8